MLGVWYHIVTTVSGTTMRSYINGALQGEKSDGWEPNTIARSNCYVGKPNWVSEGHLNGAVASLKIYSGAMTQAEVTAAYGSFTFTLAPTSYATAAPSHYPTAEPSAAPSTAVILNFDWDFKNAATNTIVDSVGGIVATLTNADGTGRTATGIALDGTNDHLVLDFSSTQLGGPMTIEVVGKWAAFNSYSPLFDCGNAGGDNSNIDIFNVGTTPVRACAT